MCKQVEGRKNYKFVSSFNRLLQLLPQTNTKSHSFFKLRKRETCRFRFSESNRIQFAVRLSSKHSSARFPSYSTTQQALSNMPNFRASLTLRMASLLVLFAACCTTCDALRMINFDAPDSAFQGDTIHLSCFFTLRNGHQHTLDSTQSEPGGKKSKSNLSSIFNGGDTSANLHKKLGAPARSPISEPSNVVEQLYAVKWYKDEREFFRYLAQDWPRKQALPVEGLFVELDKSDNYTVVLRNVSLKTSGQFRCEVSTDAPYFVTKSIERKLLIYSLPNEGPVIEILRQPGTNQQKGRYFINEQVELKCSTSESKPAATLDWIINDFLNLSAPIGSQLRQIFTIETKRFVRIPSVNRSSSSNYQAIGRLASKAVSRQPVFSFDTYELYGDNTSLVVNPENEKETTLVDLANGSLDQLLETSISRLNFSVDDNLLQLLSYLDESTLEEGSTYQTRVGQSSRQSLSLERTPIKGSPLFLPNSAGSETKTWVQLSINAIRRIKRSKFASELPSVYHSYPPPSSLPQPLVHTSKSQSSSSSFITGARRLGQKGTPFMNDPHGKQVQLKIKCVARLLQLTMSHRTKIHLVNKTRARDEDSTLINALRRQHTSEKNSAAIFGLSNFQVVFTSFAYLFIEVWMVFS